MYGKGTIRVFILYSALVCAVAFPNFAPPKIPTSLTSVDTNSTVGNLGSSTDSQAQTTEELKKKAEECAANPKAEGCQDLKDLAEAEEAQKEKFKEAEEKIGDNKDAVRRDGGETGTESSADGAPKSTEIAEGPKPEPKTSTEATTSDAEDPSTDPQLADMKDYKPASATEAETAGTSTSTDETTVAKTEESLWDQSLKKFDEFTTSAKEVVSSSSDEIKKAMAGYEYYSGIEDADYGKVKSAAANMGEVVGREAEAYARENPVTPSESFGPVTQEEFLAKYPQDANTLQDARRDVFSSSTEGVDEYVDKLFANPETIANGDELGQATVEAYQGQLNYAEDKAAVAGANGQGAKEMAYKVAATDISKVGTAENIGAESNDFVQFVMKDAGYDEIKRTNGYVPKTGGSSTASETNVVLGEPQPMSSTGQSPMQTSQTTQNPASSTTEPMTKSFEPATVTEPAPVAKSTSPGTTRSASTVPAEAPASTQKIPAPSTTSEAKSPPPYVEVPQTAPPSSAPTIEPVETPADALDVANKPAAAPASVEEAPATTAVEKKPEKIAEKTTAKEEAHTEHASTGHSGGSQQEGSGEPSSSPPMMPSSSPPSSKSSGGSSSSTPTPVAAAKQESTPTVDLTAASNVSTPSVTSTSLPSSTKSSSVDPIADVEPDPEPEPEPVIPNVPKSSMVATTGGEALNTDSEAAGVKSTTPAKPVPSYSPVQASNISGGSHGMSASGSSGSSGGGGGSSMPMISNASSGGSSSLSSSFFSTVFGENPPAESTEVAGSTVPVGTSSTSSQSTFDYVYSSAVSAAEGVINSVLGPPVDPYASLEPTGSQRGLASESSASTESSDAPQDSLLAAAVKPSFSTSKKTSSK